MGADGERRKVCTPANSEHASGEQEPDDGHPGMATTGTAEEGGEPVWEYGWVCG